MGMDMMPAPDMPAADMAKDSDMAVDMNSPDMQAIDMADQGM